MNDVMPLSAFELLSADEQAAVSEYVQFLERLASRTGARIADLAEQPIPPELVARSRGMFLKPLVRAALATRLQAAADEQDIAPSRVVAEHAALAFSNMADFVKIGQFGELSIDITRATRDQMRAVKSIETTDTPAGRKIKLVLYDKQPSLVALQSVMEMPVIMEPGKDRNAGRIAKGPDAEKSYTALLESLK